MQTGKMEISQLRESVVAVPPLARKEDYQIDFEENGKIIHHLESGGIRSLLYGGNANYYNIALSDFRISLEMLTETAGPETLVIPSIGPSFGFICDQIEVLKDFAFPTVMVLPASFACTTSGIATGIRKACEKLGKPVVIYIKNEGYLNNSDVASMVHDGLVSVIKYAIVRENASEDPVLSDLIQRVDPKMIMSGIGEQPAITHLTQFELGGFTSGCVCVAPSQSTSMLKALVSGDLNHAEHVRRVFEPLEDLRNEINPIRVLHEAVELAGIAKTGPHYPNMSPIPESDRDRVKKAAEMLLHLNLVSV